MMSHNVILFCGGEGGNHNFCLSVDIICPLHRTVVIVYILCSDIVTQRLDNFLGGGGKDNFVSAGIMIAFV